MERNQNPNDWQQAPGLPTQPQASDNPENPEVDQTQSAPTPSPVSPTPTPTVQSSAQPPKSNKVLKIVLFLMILVLLGLGGFILIQNQTIKDKLLPIKTSPTPTQNPVSSSTPTPDPTADWKTYKNEKYGFEIKYFPESTPAETVGSEEVGQFTYIYKINFGTVPLKSPHGYILTIRRGVSLSNLQTELVGHTTDKIDSVEEVSINNNNWTKINFQMFVTTENVPVTEAFINYGSYGYAVTASSLDIDQILSTFQFIK